MHLRVTLLLIACGLLGGSHGTFIVSAGTTAAGAAAYGVAALGVAALAVIKGLLIGNALSRGRRDVSSQQQEEVVQIGLEVAEQLDTAGCVAKLLCELETLPADQLSPAMATLKAAFDNPNQLNFHRLKTPRGVYDLAITFGAKVAKSDPKACDRLFEKCPLPRQELFDMVESTFAC